MRTTSLFIEVPKARLICSAIRGHPQVGLRCFIATTARIKSAVGPFGPGLARCFGENSSRYFCWTSARWKFKNVEGLNAIATRRNRLGLIQSEQNPAISRSRIRRLGARLRERLTINNWCLVRMDSATTARTPPSRASRKTIVMRWTMRTIRSRMRNVNKGENRRIHVECGIRHPQLQKGSPCLLVSAHKLAHLKLRRCLASAAWTSSWSVSQKPGFSQWLLFGSKRFEMNLLVLRFLTPPEAVDNSNRSKSESANGGGLL
jgi:hypothetical protein